MPTTSASPPHRWSFYRAGGVDQVRIDKGADVFNLRHLDQKLWVALSCPVKGLEFDARTLALLDTDGDSHVRPPEILAAIEWLRQVVKNPDDLVKGHDAVALSNIRDDTAVGKTLLAAAKHVLAALGKASATAITLDDTLKTAEVFHKAKLNGDGIVPPAAIDDPAARRVALEIIDCLGGQTDRSGQPGIDAAKVAQFFDDCAAFDAWWRKAEADAKTVLPLRDATPQAVAVLDAVRTKIDDYFGRCRLAAYDARALAAVNREETAYLDVVAKDLTITAAEVASFPLAFVEAGKPLSLTSGINPAWTDAVARFRETCCPDKTVLSEPDWIALCGRFAPYKRWAAEAAGKSIEKLSVARVREILAGKSKDALAKAIADDLAVAPEIDAIASVEKLARMHRDLHKLLNNYVSFVDFYARRGAIFQAGRLYLDGRSCDLCFHVNDGGKHATMAPMARTYLTYVDCTRPGGARMQIACAFTAGDSDNLFVGRNGIFYDRQGRDWNATVSKIVDNPISIGQAFWAPYKKVMRWIEESIAKRAAAADEAANARLTQAAALTGEAAKTGEAKVKPKFDVGVVAALGVAVGGITAALSTFLAAFFGLGPWIPLGLVGLLLAISGPSMLIAWLKLRQRNLGPILDANGWAVNTLTKVNIPLGGSLTELPKLPAGSVRSLTDPYAPKRSPWPRIVVGLLLLAAVVWGLYRFNFLHRWFPDYIPAHHQDVRLILPDTATPKEVVSIEVRSGAPRLSIVDLATNREIEGTAVAGGRVTFAIPEGAAPGSKFRVTDVVTGESHEIEVVGKK
jgi:hypothetical protein